MNEFDDLKKAFDEITPVPDRVRKAEILTFAVENFNRHQESKEGMRHKRDKERKGSIMSRFKPLLAMSTAVAAVGVIAFIPSRDLGPVLPVSTTDQMEIAGASSNTLKSDEGMLQSRLSSDQSIMSAPAEVEMLQDASPIVQMPLQQNRAFSGKMAPAGSSVFMMESVPQPLPQSDVVRIDDNTEAFSNNTLNAIKIVSQDPVSTISSDVDTASYGIVRSSLNRGSFPPKAAVRIEEIINYFPYQYALPEGEHPFAPSARIVSNPWNPQTQLLHIAVQGAVSERRPSNLVFLIDTSGSMNNPDKLPLLKSAFKLLLSTLDEKDQVAIVTYAGTAGVVLEPTSVSDLGRDRILAAIDSLNSGGGTAGQSGLKQAYSLARSMQEEGDMSRVLLATDGDFNIGMTDIESLKAYISKEKESGIYLSVLGFGRGNLNDAIMQSLAQNGNGQAAYIDTLNEARKVLVDQVQAMEPIADDLKIQVEFNPAHVAEYRLIGYETRALAREDFSNDRVDAGDIGAGHTVTAIYEIAKPGSAGLRNEPLRYGVVEKGEEDGEAAFLRLRYKNPGEVESILMELPIMSEEKAYTLEVGYSIAMAGFGQLLSDTKYLEDWGWEEAIAFAQQYKGDDPFGYRAEAISLMRLAQSLER